MKLNCKEFYKFINCCNPELINLWEDFQNRPDPVKGDKYMISSKIDNTVHSRIAIFDRVEFDPSFENGVQHNYIFKGIDNDEEYVINSINDVYDPSLLSNKDIDKLYGFWKYSHPIKFDK